MTHQSKRPYAGSQPSIRSYFSPQTYSISSPSPSYEGRTPPLPANVQSNLLSVGMRVRKSVPEGYKTGTYAPFQQSTLPSNTIPAPVSNKEKPRTRPRAGNRELTPFCGILKIGGMAQQPWEIYNSPSAQNSEGDEMDDDDDECPVLSQGSTISDVSITSPNMSSMKRRFFEDEDEVLEFGTGESGKALGERILAVPRRKKWVGKVPEVGIVGQESLEFQHGGLGGRDMDFDFGEADFLVFGGSDDLEMSG